MSIDIRIYFDACCFIDLAQHELKLKADADREPHVFYCRKFIDAARAKEAIVLTSTLTVAECSSVKDISKPEHERKIRSDEVRRLFQGLLLSGKSGVLPAQPTPLIVEKARDLVWVEGTTLKAMDALHIATALLHKCSHFVTTDGLGGEENLAIIRGLGLAICSADKIAHFLPDRYKQLHLTPALPRQA